MGFWFWRRPKIYGCRITLEQLEERIVLDAAGGASQIDDHHDNAHQPTQETQQAAGQGSAQTAAPPPGGQTPAGQNAAAQPQHTDPITQVFHQDLNVVLVSNDLHEIKGISDAAVQGTKVIVYDAQKDNLNTISGMLDQLVKSTGQKIDNLAVVGHGSQGELTIGADQITFFNVAQFEPVLKTIGTDLAPNAQIQFYGCSVAGDAFGQALVDRIATFTAANVFASVNTTGGTWHDWTLEYSSDSSAKVDTLFDTARLSALDSETLFGSWPGSDISGFWFVEDINSAGTSSFGVYPWLTNVNGIVFFVASDGSNGMELWRTDGIAGPGHTFMVKDINPSGDSNPELLTNVNGTLFFRADDGASGIELWKSDGTAGGTVMVKDIRPSVGFGSTPVNLTNVNGILFFQANDGTNGVELWKSDGTDSGTVMVKDINTTGNSSPNCFVNVNGTLFFQADDGTNGMELWKSDGSEGGTVMVKDINTAGDSNPSFMANVNGTLFFAANNGTDGIELWKSDGSEGGTTIVKNINPSGDSNPTSLTNVNGTLFFCASNGTNGLELWKSDGSEGGTTMVKDINPSGDSGPINIVNLNGTALFIANDGTHGSEPWKSDGTDPGTVMVLDINSGAASSNITGIGQPVPGGTAAIFGADDGTHGKEPWRTDGTAAGTFIRADINPGSGSSNPVSGAWDGTTLYIGADDGVHGTELWAWRNNTPVNLLVQPPVVYEDTGLSLGSALSVSDDPHDTLTVVLDATAGLSSISLTNPGGCSTFSGAGTHWTMTGTASQINSNLDTLTGALISNFSGQAQIQISTTDQNTLNDTVTLYLPVKPVNDAPVFAPSLPGSVNTTGPTDPITFSLANGNAISFSDVDAGTETVAMRLVATGGTISLSGITGLAFRVGDGTSDAEMIFTGMIDAMNTALNGLVYTPLSSTPAVGSLLVSMSDAGKSGFGGVMSTGKNVDIYINGGTASANQAPVNNVPGTPVIDANTSCTFSFAADRLIWVDPVDGSGTQEVSVTLVLVSVTGALSPVGTLTLASESNLTFLEGDGISDSKMNFRGSVDDVNAALDGLVFQPNPDFVGNAYIRIITNDLGHGGTGGIMGDMDTVMVTVNGTPNQPPVNHVPGQQTTDVDTDLNFATIWIEDPDALGADVRVGLIAQHGTINLSGTAGLTFLLGDGTDDASMRFTGTISSINNALMNMTFTPETGYTGWADIFIGTNDLGNTGLGGPKSDLDKVDIIVGSPGSVPSNVGPTLTAPQFVWCYDDDPITFTAGQLSVSDPDVGASQLVVVGLGAAHGTLTLGGSTGLTFLVGDGTNDTQIGVLGTIADINNALTGLKFQPDAGYSGPAGIGLNVNDTGNSGTGGPYQTQVNMDVWVYAVNDAPVIQTPWAQAIKSINPGTGGGVELGGFVYFAADDGVNGTELWRTDGTPDGTTLVKDINLAGGSNPQNFAVSGGILYFSAYDGVNGYELWKTDGTTGGTQMVLDINSAGLSSNPSYLADVGGTLFFAADDGTHGMELWKTDGTGPGTVLVKDISGAANSNPQSIVNLGGNALFSADDSVNGRELWISDGTPGGTAMVKDILAGASGSDPAYLTVAGSAAYFAASGPEGHELWVTDGTFGGTHIVKDINTAGNGLPWPSISEFCHIGGIVYFGASDGTHGQELWRSDGTSAGTYMVKDIVAGSPNSNPENLFNFNGSLFFTAHNSAYGYELWKSDGTAAGTNLFADLRPGLDSGSPSQFLATATELFFVAWPGPSAGALFRTDGTSEPEVLNIGMIDGTEPDTIAATDDYVLFDPATGKLWRADATPHNIYAHQDTDLQFGLGCGAIRIEDADAETSDIQVEFLATHGTISLLSTTGLSFSFSDNNGTGAGDGDHDVLMRFRGSQSAINTAFGTMCFTPDTGFNTPTNGLATITISTHDLYHSGLGVDPGTATETININVLPANHAPVLDNTGTMNLTWITSEQTTNTGNSVASIIASAGGDRITDPDAGAVEGIAITATAQSYGTWQYSIDDGGSWTDVGAVSGVSALLLRDTDLVRFVPDGVHAGDGTITFHAWDQYTGAAGDKVDASSPGGYTPFSAASETGAIDVVPISGLTLERFASDGELQDRYGISVSISGDWAIVGAYNDTVGSNGAQGSAYLYYRDQGGTDAWGFVKQITASDGAALDEFGYAVSISGDWAVVGARYAADGGNADEGVAYIFHRDEGGANNWGEVKRITGSDAGDSDWFGWSVSIDGSWAVVGAVSHDPVAGANAGAAYIFHWDGGLYNNWSEAKKLVASDGAADDNFAWAVAVSGSDVVVGSPHVTGLDTGAAYIFHWNGPLIGDWSTGLKITSSDQAQDDYFGRSVSISGDHVVVGVGHDDVGANADQGSAHLFYRNQGGADNWGEIKRLTAPDGGANAQFGDSVSISGDYLIVGAVSDNSVGAGSGSAYVFMRTLGGTDNWGLVEKVIASDAAVGDAFGDSVAFSGTTYIAGATWGDGTVADSGSTYLSGTYSNTAPVLDSSGNPLMSPVLVNDANPAGTTVASIIGTAISDADSGAVEGIAVALVQEGVGVGDWQYSIDNGAMWTSFHGVAIDSAVVLTDAASNLIRFVPATDYSGSPYFVYYAWDRTDGLSNGHADASIVGGGSNAYSFSGEEVHVWVNRAPVLDNSGEPRLPAVLVDDPNPGGTVVATLAGATISDNDSGAVEGIAVTGFTGTGNWQYWNAGWINFGAVSDTSATLLGDGHQVRFLPEAGWSGQATITYRAWDQTDNHLPFAVGVNVSVNGNETAYSTASDTAVVSVNSAPVLDSSGNPLMSPVLVNDANPGGTTVASIIGTAISDADSGAVEGIAVALVQEGVGVGDWQYSIDNGAMWTSFHGVAIDSAVVLTDAASNLIRFVPATDYSGSPYFVYYAWDRTDGLANGHADASIVGGGSNAYSFSGEEVHVWVNRAPVLDNSGEPRLPAVLVDDPNPGGTVVATLAGATISDNDSSAVEGIAVTGFTGTGNWQYWNAGWINFGAVSDTSATLLGDGHQVRFLPEAGWSGQATITYRAWDQTDNHLPFAVGVNVSVNGNETAYSTASDTAVVSVNSAPVLDSSGNPLMSPVLVNDANPGGTTVASIIGTAISDADSGAVEGIAVALVQEGVGVGDWQYSIDNGAMWTSFHGVAIDSAVVLTDAAGNLIRFVPATDYSGSPYFVYYAWDRTDGLANGHADASIVGGGSNAYSFSGEEVHVWVNRAPVLDNSGEPRLPAVLVDDPNPGGTVVATLAGATISDNDSGAVEGIAVTGYTGTGNWQYWNAGWINFGAVSDTSATLLGDGHQVRFLPEAGWSGQATITYRAWDQTDNHLSFAAGVNVSVNGNETAYSTASDTAVVSVNRAPVLDSSGNPLMSPVLVNATDPAGTTVASIIGTAISDADSGAVEGIAVASVQEGVGVGDWQYSIDNGATWTSFHGVAIDSAVVLTDAAGNLIRFVPATDYSGSPYFVYYAWDRTDGLSNGYADASIVGGGSNAYSFNGEEVHVWVNQAPVLDNSGEPRLPAVLVDDPNPGGTVVATMAGATISDNDSSAVEGIAVTGYTGTGNWQYWNAGWINFGAVSDTSATLLGDGHEVRFLPEAGWSGQATITYRAWDQTDNHLSFAAGVNVSVNGNETAYSTASDTAVVSVNRAPVLDNSGNPLMSPVLVNDANPAGTTVASIIGTAISDADSGAVEGIAVASVQEGVGVGDWQYSIDNGATWTSFHGVAIDSAVVLTDAAGNLIRFVPATDYSGSPYFVYYAWDRTDGLSNGYADASIVGGGSNAYSFNGEEVHVWVNQAPVLSGPGSLVPINENDSNPPGRQVADIISGTLTDLDGPTAGIAVTGVDDSHGTWQYWAGAWQDFYTGVALSDANATLLNGSASIRFVPDSDWSGSATVTYRAWDTTDGRAGGETGVNVSSNGDAFAYSSAAFGATQTVIALNAAPTVEATISDVTVNEDAADTVFSLYPNFQDAEDTDGQLTYTVTGNTNPALFAALDIGDPTNFTLDYAPNANGTADITIRATDTGGLWAEDTFTVTVNPVNDAPTAGSVVASGDEDTNIVVDGWNFTDAHDAPPSGGDYITITSLPANGSLLYDADHNGTFETTLSVSSTVPWADAIGGRVAFHGTADWNGATSFNYTVTDDGGTLNGGQDTSAAAAVNLTVNAANDAPTISNPGAQSTSEDTPLVFNAGNGNLITVGDVDAAPTDIIGVSIDVQTGHGLATLGSTAGITILNGGNGTYYMYFEGQLSDVNTALNGLTYTPDANYSGPAGGFHIQVDDKGYTGLPGNLVSGLDVHVTVNAVNDAPVLHTDGTIPPIAEDVPDLTNAGQMVSNIIAGTVTDADTSDPNGIAVVGVGPDGQWQYSLNNGSHWNNFGAVGDTAATLLAADLNTRIRFVPVADWNGTAEIMYRAWDQSDGHMTGDTNVDVSVNGGTTAYSVAAHSTWSTVNAVNDAPVAGNMNQVHSMNEDTAPLHLSSISVADADDGVGGYTETITARLTLNNPAAGDIQSIGGTYNPVSGIWEITDTVANVYTSVANMIFAPAEDWNGVASITTHIQDAVGAGPADGAINVTVNAVNDVPAASNMTASHTLAEDSGPYPLNGFGTSNIVVTDPDAGDTITATLTLGDISSGVLSANDGATYTPATGLWSISGTVAQVNTALANVTFTPSAGWNGTVGISTHIEDAAHTGPADGAISMTVTGANDAPTVTNLNQAHTVTEDSGALNLTDIVVTDADVGDTITATLTLSDHAAGALSATDGATYTPATGIWSISGTVAQVNTALANVTFTPAANWSGTTSITTHIEDAAPAGPSDGIIGLTVTGANDAPTATNMGQSLMIPEDAGPSNLSMPIVVTDPDVGDTITATLTLGDHTASVLSSNDGAIFAPASGVWTIMGSVSQVNTALANVTFTPTANWNGPTDIAIHIEDAAHAGPVDGSVAVMVFSAPDAPTATNMTASHTLAEDSGPYPLNGFGTSTIVVTDPDAGDTITATLTLGDISSGTLSANDGATYTPATGLWSISGTVTQVNTALANVSFTPTAGWNGTVGITTDVHDAAPSGPAPGLISMTVTGANDAPTATNLNQTHTVAEDSGALNLTDIVVTDADVGDTITATLTLADHTAGTLNSSAGTYDSVSGVWTYTGSVAQVNTALANAMFTTAANWSGTTSIMTHIEDAAHTGPAPGTIALNVTGVNDAPSATPSMTQDHTGAAAILEDHQLLLDSIQVTDLDGPTEQITAVLTVNNPSAGSISASGGSYDPMSHAWSMTGSLPMVNAALSSLTFVPAANWNGLVNIATHIEDAAHTGPLPDGTITVEVTAVNDPPTATNLNQTHTVAEGSGPVDLDNIVVTDVDDAVVTASLTPGDPTAGTLSANDGATVDPGTGAWSINGTLAVVNTALANVTFTPGADWQGTTITVHVEDAAHTSADGILSLVLPSSGSSQTTTQTTQTPPSSTPPPSTDTTAPPAPQSTVTTAPDVQSTTSSTQPAQSAVDALTPTLTFQPEQPAAAAPLAEQLQAAETQQAEGQQAEAQQAEQAAAAAAAAEAPLAPGEQGPTKEGAPGQKPGPDQTTGETKVSMETLAAATRDAAPGKGPVALTLVAGKPGVVPGQAPVLPAPQVLVFNMAHVSTMDLFTSAKVELGATPMGKSGSLGTYLNDSAPPPSASITERAAQAMEKAETQMWDNVSKHIPGCTRCSELAGQAVQVFW